ncbi:TadE/TadG family type IV pilus assembly protein [Rhizobium paknamense]|uniref:Flp pilus assembly protein TadG n=1 Tax=Rhizobium paknamense TaxID=1206817 RepID=A0ABU0ICZ8_9HYPH|nr:TadE/TadG family type IV pilus assembly protein [Rhizobium paknamense]MDQ0455136.1 Flp pilus assembly protein TadG [Rhizobium paknamense]
MEFAILLVPFCILVFALLDLALVFFVSSALDSALDTAARSVRLGKAYSEQWTLADFKTQVCNNMAWQFDCEHSLRISTTVLKNFSDVQLANPATDAIALIPESFDPGNSRTYMSIQAFLTWPSLLSALGMEPYPVVNGNYVLSEAVLFRNEPFGN